MKMSLTLSDILIFITILNVGARGWIDDGRNFLVACPSLQTASPTVDCTLHVMGSEGVQVSITGTLSGLPKTETISSALLIRITIQGDYSIAQLLVVTTSDVVSVFVENRAQGGQSLYLAIPLSDDLTQPYTGSPVETFLMAFPITSSERNVFVVGSAYDGNLITLTVNSTGPFIYNTVTYNDGDPLSVTLEAGEVLEIITDQDLTGTHVQATKPVGVFSGTKVQPTLEQIPLLPQWGDLLILPYFDFCKNITVRTLVSQDSTTITLRRDYNTLAVVRNRGEYFDHKNNETSVVDSKTSLVGVRCALDDHPFTMLLPPHTGMGKEFKCLTLSGFNNSAYIVNQARSDVNFKVSGSETLFTIVHTQDSTDVSTVKTSVTGGYLIIKSNYAKPVEPYVGGVNSNGAYGYACAKGTMGSLLPDPLNSLVDVPLAVYSPIPSLELSTSKAASSSDVNIASSSEPLSSSPTSTYISMTSSAEQIPESSTISASPTSRSDAATSTDSSSDINIASTTEPLLPSLSPSEHMFESTSFPSSEDLAPATVSTTEVVSVSLMIRTPSKVQMTDSSILSVGPTSLVLTTSSIVTISKIYTTATETSSSDTSTAFSTVTTTPTEATSQIQELCFCRCGENMILSNETKAFLEKFDIEIKQNLTLDIKNISSYIRSKTSAKDDRPSAQNVGYFGISIMCITGCLIVFADVLNLFKKCKPRRKRV